MPKQVDHELRRRQITEAAARIATTRGLQSLTFREVAAQAGVSVSLVQHYFGAKERLVVDTLDIQSLRLGARILAELDGLGPDAGPMQRVREIAVAFLPVDRESREAMLLYLGFAGAALTDELLRQADAFSNADMLRATLAGELRNARAAGALNPAVDPGNEALILLSLVLGLSLVILLERASASEAIETLDSHLGLLTN